MHIIKGESTEMWWSWWGSYRDENRNVTKLCYATLPTGLGAKPIAGRLGKSPMGKRWGSKRRREVEGGVG